MVWTVESERRERGESWGCGEAMVCEKYTDMMDRVVFEEMNC